MKKGDEIEEPVMFKATRRFFEDSTLHKTKGIAEIKGKHYEYTYDMVKQVIIESKLFTGDLYGAQYKNGVALTHEKKLEKPKKRKIKKGKRAKKR